MRVLVLSSGGKDSAYALWWSLMKGWDVAGLVTIRTTGDESMMFQGAGTEIVGLQALASGLPWLPIIQSKENGVESLELGLAGVIQGINWPRSQVWTNSEIRDAAWPKLWAWPKELVRLRCDKAIDGIVSGAIRSDYQRTRLDRMANRLGIQSFAPLWHHNAEQHMRDLVRDRFSVIIAAVSAEGLTKHWLGRTIDDKVIDELVSLNKINGLNIDGEGGEFETIVTAAPWMQHEIQLKFTTDWQKTRGRIIIETATC